MSDVRRRRALTPARTVRGALLCLALSSNACLNERAPEAAPAAPPPRARDAAPPTPPSTPQPPYATPPAGEEAEPAPAASPEPATGGPKRKATAPSAAPAPAKPSPRRDNVPERRRAVAAEDAEEDAKGSDTASPEALFEELGRIAELSAPDCPSARERNQSICELAARICRLVDRDPNVASVGDYCSEARRRCADAQRRTAERCDR